jgi:tRNA (guanine-N7-)-methyltransferase
LEVGIGKGDFIIGMASRFPGHYLGLEKEISIAGIAAKKVVASGLDNIRLRADDFDDVYPEIETLRFDKIFLNFSDPWPKKKHAKRRLTAAPRLNQMAALLKEGGLIVIKTDNDILYEFTLEEIEKTKLTLAVNLFDYPADESGDVQSEYEKNFRSLGQPIHRIILKK